MSIGKEQLGYRTVTLGLLWIIGMMAGLSLKGGLLVPWQ